MTKLFFICMRCTGKNINVKLDSLSNLSNNLFVFHAGEHLSDDYEQNVNRFKKIPAIVDNDFKLAESIAIYRYLASEHEIVDNWYPKDPKKRARVDEYLEWQHVSI